MYIVSACLAGFRTRYDGRSMLDGRVKALVLEGRAVAVCPEQLAGLGTPRPPVELRGGGGGDLLEGRATAVGNDGMDYSSALCKGAEEVLRIAALYGVRKAVLKDGSPSCGVTYIYREGRKIGGRGVVSELLLRNNIRVMTVDSL
jgi:uncharacterized protein YbbK (DUF523 family)